MPKDHFFVTRLSLCHSLALRVLRVIYRKSLPAVEEQYSLFSHSSWQGSVVLNLIPLKLIMESSSFKVGQTDFTYLAKWVKKDDFPRKIYKSGKMHFVERCTVWRMSISEKNRIVK